jgi:hypothetical protein
VTDAGLKVITTFKQLRTLAHSETGATDSGLKEWATKRQLLRLLAIDTAVTDAAVRELRRALPERDIIRYHSDIKRPPFKPKRPR